MYGDVGWDVQGLQMSETGSGIDRSVPPLRCNVVMNVVIDQGQSGDMCDDQCVHR